MRDSTILAIREEEKISGLNPVETPFDLHALSRLLPRIAEQLYPVKGKDRLHHPRAISAPWRYSAPLVPGALKQPGRRRNERVGMRRENLAALHQVHRPPAHAASLPNQ